MLTTFTVNSVLDAVDANPGDGSAATSTGVTTLRAAIQEANALAGSDTINIPAGTYTLTISGRAEDASATGDLDITSNLTINGAGAATTIIDGNFIDRVLQIFPGASVKISGVTIQNGATIGIAFVSAAGGGIANNGGTLTLTDCVVTNNDSGGNTNTSTKNGGGITNGDEFNQAGGTLTLIRTTVTGNKTDRGGGIFNNDQGTLIVQDSTIDGNTAFQDGGGISCGAFSNNLTANITITRSTISNNTAPAGGGIAMARGDLTIVNSTISGNHGTSNGSAGGGISNLSGGAKSISIFSSTITANTAVGSAGGIDAGALPVVMANTIVAGNASASQPDFSGTIDSRGFNLIQNTSGTTIGGNTTGNILGKSADLGPLANNGGPTKTHAELPKSHAINAGDPTGPKDGTGTGLTIDQRGTARVQGGRADIGAFETDCGTLVTNTNDSGPGTLRQAIDCANALAGQDTITFDIPGAGVHTISSLSEMQITDSVIIDGYSQPGSSPNTNPIDQPDNAVLLVQLDGSNSVANGISISANGTTIRGLVLSNFLGGGGGAALILGGGGATVAGCFIGTDATGTVAAPNQYGIKLNSTAGSNTIGGTAAADRNVISANTIGINAVAGAGLNNNTLIQGNFIGTKVNGTSKFPSSGTGILLQSGDNAIIGGTTTAARNVISGNGVGIDNQTGTFGINALIQGNYIGVDRTGASALTNVTGISVVALGTTIGGTTAGAGNVITSSNIGIDLASSQELVEGNFIGTDSTGTLDLGTQIIGIRATSATQTTIGGTAPGAGNTIAFTKAGANGAGIESNANGSIAIFGNSIFGNDGPGIFFVTGSPPIPVLTSATATTITGTLDGTPDDVYRVEFFATPDTGLTSHDEGKTFLGSKDVTIGQNNSVNFTFTPLGGIPLGELVTATATLQGGSTSRFSGFVTAAVSTAVDLSLSMTAEPQAPKVGQDVTYTIVVTNNSSTDAAVGAQIIDTLPTNATFVSATGNVTPVSGQLTFDLGSLAAGASVTRTITVHPTGQAGDTVANTAKAQSSVGDPDSSNDQRTVTFTLQAVPVPSADLSVAMTASPNPSVVGQDVTYTIVVTNSGPDPVTGATVVDTLPTNATFVSATGGVTPVSGLVTFDLGTLAKDASVTRTVTVHPTGSAGDTVANAVSASSSVGDPDSTNNQSSVTFSLQPAPPPSAELGVTIPGAPTQVAPGGNITYTIMVTNAGPDAAQDVRLSTNVPAGTTFVSLTTPAGWVSTLPAPGSTGAIAATLSQLAAGQQTFTLVVHVNDTLTAGTSVPLQVQVTSETSDPSSANNSANKSTTVVIPPTDTVGPHIASLQRFGFHVQPTLLVLTFDEPLDAAGASSAATYVLSTAGADGRFGTKDDRAIALRSVTLSPNGEVVTLAPRRLLPLRLAYQLVIRGGSGGVTDLAGNSLDGGDQTIHFNRSALAGPSAGAAARNRLFAILGVDPSLLIKPTTKSKTRRS